MRTPVRIGVLRLADSAPVMVAQRDGLFAAQGLDATVSIEPSWANIADKLAYGLLDAAVMLPPLALAAALGLRGPRTDLVVPMGLTQGGNSIVLGGAAAEAVTTHSGAALLDWLRAQKTPPRFAVVHWFSTHNLLLRYWLAQGGADPDRDIETIVVPPEQVVEALASRRIAGFCAGAPWGDVARLQGKGQVLIGTSSIWPGHPEKCLAVQASWSEAHGTALRGLLRALLRSQTLCDSEAHGDRITALLARPDGLALPEAATRAALPGGTGIEQIRFHRKETWFPAQAHALWFLGQMRRWGWLPEGLDLPAEAQRIYRADLLSPVVAEKGLYSAAPLPSLEADAMLPQPDEDRFSAS